MFARYMGVDIFGISMRFVESGVQAQVREILQGYAQIQLRGEGEAAGFECMTAEYNDGSHFIEFQLSREIANDECTLAIRFSLCSYPSIDAIFVEIVKHVLSAHEATVWLMTSALRQKRHFPPGELEWLAAALPDEISAMRAYWQGLFGIRQGVVRVDDSFSFVGLDL